MNQTISILGCGWLGKPLALELINKGYKVNGSTRSKIKSSKLESEGIRPFVIDLDNDKLDVTKFLNADVLVIAVPSKNIAGFKQLIKNVEESDLRKVIFISSTSVYPNSNETVTEETTVKQTALAKIEQLFITSPILETTILRFGGLFGYDRKPGDFVKPSKLVKNPAGYINFIHRDDCIQIIEKIIAKDVWNEVFNACSDSHPKRRNFYLKEAKKVGKPNITFDENSDNNYKIVHSQKLKEALDYTFKYADLMNY